MASQSPTKALPLPPPFYPPSSKQANKILTPLAVLAYLLSLAALAYGVWLLTTHDYSCQELLGLPELRIAIGLGLILFFVVNNTVVYYGEAMVMPGCVVLSVTLVVMLTSGLALAGTCQSEARGMPASPMWLRARVMAAERWANVENCLRGEGICRELAYRTAQLTSHRAFRMKHLSAIESGCCKPPDLCGMEYVNATYWNARLAKGGGHGAPVPDSATNPSFSDCRMWSNEPRLLCYECHSCKMGFLKTISSQWRETGVFLIVMSVLFVTLHALRFSILMFERYNL